MNALPSSGAFIRSKKVYTTMAPSPQLAQRHIFGNKLDTLYIKTSNKYTNKEQTAVASSQLSQQVFPASVNSNNTTTIHNNTNRPSWKMEVSPSKTMTTIIGQPERWWSVLEQQPQHKQSFLQFLGALFGNLGWGLAIKGIFNTVEHSPQLFPVG
jgi:hypothetical protein